MNANIHVGDCRSLLRALPEASAHCCVTSPPYWGLRDYGVDGQIGLESSPEAFVTELVAVFREVRRVLRDDGTLWLNLGDSYAGSGRGIGDTKTNNKGSIASRHFHSQQVSGGALGRAWTKPPAGLKPKDLVGIPWMVAFALRADGWFLRSDIIWAKPNPMPESVTDRPTRSHEYLFLLTKSDRYYFDAAAIREPATTSGNGNKGRRLATSGEQDRTNSHLGYAFAWTDDGRGRNKRDVWTVPTQAFGGAHFATFPPRLIEPCILAGAPAGGVVLDPFGGAGTTGLVAKQLGRESVLIELNPAYADIARDRIARATHQATLQLETP